VAQFVGQIIQGHFTSTGIGLGINLSGSHLQKHLLPLLRIRVQSLTGAVPKGQLASNAALLFFGMVAKPLLTKKVKVISVINREDTKTKIKNSDLFFFIFI